VQLDYELIRGKVRRLLDRVVPGTYTALEFHLNRVLGVENPVKVLCEEPRRFYDALAKIIAPYGGEEGVDIFLKTFIMVIVPEDIGASIGFIIKAIKDNDKETMMELCSKIASEE